MLSSEAIDKAGVLTKHIAGSEAVTDLEHVKATVGDIAVKRPYHKAADAKAIADNNPDEVERGFNLIDWYLHVLGCLPLEVFEYTRRVVADAFFSKRNFVDGLAKMGLKIISRFRDDAALYYLYKGPKTGLPGAPKKYDGKVDVDNLNMKVFFKLDYAFDGGEYGAHFARILADVGKMWGNFRKEKSLNLLFLKV